MDVQMKKGLLDVCVLALLSRGDSYGYQIISELKGVVEVSESTLYPILKRLEAANQLTTYTMEHGGRLRRYYSVTKLGLSRVEEFDREWEQLIKIRKFIKEGSDRD